MKTEQLLKQQLSNLYPTVSASAKLITRIEALEDKHYQRRRNRNIARAVVYGALAIALGIYAVPRASAFVAFKQIDSAMRAQKDWQISMLALGPDGSYHEYGHTFIKGKSGLTVGPNDTESWNPSECLVYSPGTSYIEKLPPNRHLSEFDNLDSQLSWSILNFGTKVEHHVKVEGQDTCIIAAQSLFEPSRILICSNEQTHLPFLFILEGPNGNNGWQEMLRMKLTPKKVTTKMVELPQLNSFPILSKAQVLAAIQKKYSKPIAIRTFQTAVQSFQTNLTRMEPVKVSVNNVFVNPDGDVMILYGERNRNLMPVSLTDDKGRIYISSTNNLAQMERDDFINIMGSEGQAAIFYPLHKLKSPANHFYLNFSRSLNQIALGGLDEFQYLSFDSRNSSNNKSTMNLSAPRPSTAWVPEWGNFTSIFAYTRPEVLADAALSRAAYYDNAQDYPNAEKEARKALFYRNEAAAEGVTYANIDVHCALAHILYKEGRYLEAKQNIEKAIDFTDARNTDELEGERKFLALIQGKLNRS